MYFIFRMQVKLMDSGPIHHMYPYTYAILG
jgi:hypothetical protein